MYSGKLSLCFVLIFSCVLETYSNETGQETSTLAQEVFGLTDDPPVGELRGIRYPCHCDKSQCGCCTGNFIQAIKQRGCVNMTYKGEDSSFDMALSFNERVLYNTKISALNPAPACIPVPRLPSAGLCVKLSNVYFVGRNLHACIALEAKWNKEAAFAWNFDCLRVGADGMKIVQPEEGGGLPHPQDQSEEIEDYDENYVP